MSNAINFAGGGCLNLLRSSQPDACFIAFRKLAANIIGAARQENNTERQGVWGQQGSKAARQQGSKAARQQGSKAARQQGSKAATQNGRGVWGQHAPKIDSKE